MKFIVLPLLALVVGTANVAQSQIKIITNGSVGMGTDTPLHPLDIYHGRVNISKYSAPFRIEVVNSNPRLTSTGKVVFYNTSHTGHIPVEASAFNTASDERLKTNIQHLTSTVGAGSPLQKILQLKGYSYQWKHEVAEQLRGGKLPQNQVGFLAQELEKVIPEAVSTSTDSVELKTVAYAQVIPYLVEAIKEQQTIIEGLRKRLEQMESSKQVGNTTRIKPSPALSIEERRVAHVVQ